MFYIDDEDQNLIGICYKIFHHMNLYEIEMEVALGAHVVQREVHDDLFCRCLEIDKNTYT